MLQASFVAILCWSATDGYLGLFAIFHLWPRMYPSVNGLRQPRTFGRNHTRRLSVFVILMLLIPPSFLSQSRIPKSPQAQSWEVKGRALIQAGRFGDAVKFFSQIKQANPKDARPYFYLGMALMEIGDVSRATSELDEAVRLDPIKPEYALFKASAQTRLGQTELALKALQSFKDARQVNKLTSAWIWLLADVYYRCQQPDDALRVLEILGERTPLDSKIDLNRGQAYALKGELASARRCFEKSLQKNSASNPAAHYELGKLLHQLNEIQAAKQALEKAVKQAPGNPEYAYKLASVCLVLNQSTEAISYLQQVESSGPTQPKIYYALARALRKEGNPDQAETYLKKFVEANGKVKKQSDQNREAGKLIALGEKELDHGNKVEARRLFLEALKVAPKDWSANGYLAEMCLDSGELDQAYGHLVKMEEVEPDSVVGSYLMARYWSIRKDFPQARNYAEQAKAIRPANAELRNLLGEIYERLGLRKEARNEYEEAVKLAPKESQYQKNLKALQESAAPPHR
jgi:Flp pilus assembly protein TadD